MLPSGFLIHDFQTVRVVFFDCTIYQNLRSFSCPGPFDRDVKNIIVIAFAEKNENIFCTFQKTFICQHCIEAKYLQNAQITLTAEVRRSVAASGRPHFPKRL